MSQTLTIPAGCASYPLTFKLHIDTAESKPQSDKMTVKIGTTTLATYSNANKNTGYTQKTFDVSAYKGQTIQVYLVGTEDTSAQTSFVVDDFTLNVQ